MSQQGRVGVYLLPKNIILTRAPPSPSTPPSSPIGGAALHFMARGGCPGIACGWAVVPVNLQVLLCISRARLCLSICSYGIALCIYYCIYY